MPPLRMPNHQQSRLVPVEDATFTSPALWLWVFGQPCSSWGSYPWSTSAVCTKVDIWQSLRFPQTTQRISACCFHWNQGTNVYKGGSSITTVTRHGWAHALVGVSKWLAVKWTILPTTCLHMSRHKKFAGWRLQLQSAWGLRSRFIPTFWIW